MKKLEQIRAAEDKLLLKTYDRNPLLFTGGEGVYLIDEQGERYLDLLSGIGVNALGYGHPAIEDAIARQSRKLIHTSNLFFHEGQAELAMRLTERTGMDRVFFSNTGTEAWEGALKVARAHAGLLRSEGREIGTKFLALEGSFHGRTFGSVATTHKAKYREPFAPVMPGVEFVRFNDVADLRVKFSNDVCAILLEAIQGEGGVRPVTQEFFAEARALANSTGALLIVDEIQAGMGRTGTWCAYQHYGIQPDVTTLAKPLAGGVPLGAMLCNEEAARAIHAGMHGTTFGGGPLACAVAIAVMDTLERDGLLNHAAEVGAYFMDELRKLQKKHEAIVDVRGMGLMIGAELDSADLAKRVGAEMLKRKIIINVTSETTLRFLPPYILERAQVDTAIAALDEIFSEHGAAAGQNAKAAGGELG
ncbi:MAG TPA: aspartate aminotransferase family protein [Terracidiphilus sp.]|nr:aspartate aminotransferase family protein [Terracidiphilus sp.]